VDFWWTKWNHLASQVPDLTERQKIEQFDMVMSNIARSSVQDYLKEEVGGKSLSLLERWERVSKDLSISKYIHEIGTVYQSMNAGKLVENSTVSVVRQFPSGMWSATIVGKLDTCETLVLPPVKKDLPLELRQETQEIVGQQDQPYHRGLAKMARDPTLVLGLDKIFPGVVLKMIDVGQPVPLKVGAEIFLKIRDMIGGTLNLNLHNQVLIIINGLLLEIVDLRTGQVPHLKEIISKDVVTLLSLHGRFQIFPGPTGPGKIISPLVRNFSRDSVSDAASRVVTHHTAQVPSLGHTDADHLPPFVDLLGAIIAPSNVLTSKKLA